MLSSKQTKLGEATMAKIVALPYANIDQEVVDLLNEVYCPQEEEEVTEEELREILSQE